MEASFSSVLPPKIEPVPRKSALKKPEKKIEGNFIQRLSNLRISSLSGKSRPSTRRKKSVDFVDDEEIDAIRNSNFQRVSSVKGRPSSPDWTEENLDEIESLEGSNDSENDYEDPLTRAMMEQEEAEEEEKFESGEDGEDGLDQAIEEENEFLGRTEGASRPATVLLFV